MKKMYFQSTRKQYFGIPNEAKFRFLFREKIFKFSFQFFRHVSYLFFITLLVFFELLGVPIYVLFYFLAYYSFISYY